MNNSSSPLITVLMPVYNGEKYLHASIESILNQSFGDFEFLIINDGSTDRSAEIIDSYSDSRIRVINNEINLKLIATLNNGLRLAKGKYIARMDCDDISLPERLQKQLEFMESNPDIGICGTWIKIQGEVAGDIWIYPTDDDSIRCSMLFYSAIAHPSVIMRREIFSNAELHYNPSYVHAEDYALWVSASNHYRLANLPEDLLLHRLHPQQIGNCHKVEQLESSNMVRLQQIVKLGIKPTVEEMKLHENLSAWRLEKTKDFVRQVNEWLKKLKSTNDQSLCYPEHAFLQILGERWFEVCSTATNLGIWSWRIFWNSPLSKYVQLNFLQKIQFAINCVLKREIINV